MNYLIVVCSRVPRLLTPAAYEVLSYIAYRTLAATRHFSSQLVPGAKQIIMNVEYERPYHLRGWQLQWSK